MSIYIYDSGKHFLSYLFSTIISLCLSFQRRENHYIRCKIYFQETIYKLWCLQEEKNTYYLNLYQFLTKIKLNKAKNNL